MVQNEYRQVQEFAKTRLKQKHERKLFRPQTGVSYSKKQNRSGRNDLDRNVRTHVRLNQLSSTNFANVGSQRDSEPVMQLMDKI